jgi:hypothetical protein
LISGYGQKAAGFAANLNRTECNAGEIDAGFASHSGLLGALDYPARIWFSSASFVLPSRLFPGEGLFHQNSWQVMLRRDSFRPAFGEVNRPASDFHLVQPDNRGN